ncbi:hypothetical protein STAQ_22510 [Allostella sp. ATCC 35155]|nr:hypothetical protein STAQ_22510 [Stella sp. ATCC 35155]
MSLPALLVRLTVATAGAYLAAAAWVAAFVAIWPGGTADAVLGGTVTAFPVATAAVLWAFAARSAARALAGAVLGILVLAAIGWLAP